jgi:osmotically-inducible protein OsmY
MMETDRGKQLSLLMGIGIGATLMFFLDANRGARRRALVRDKSIKASRKLAESFSGHAEDAGNRVKGKAAEARASISGTQPTNHQLTSHVRSELGHRVEHAKAIKVSTDDGRVTLRGFVIRAELEDVLDTVRGVRGVREVVSELEIHETPGDIPALQD